VSWNKAGWRRQSNAFYTLLFNKEKGIAILQFWYRIRFAILNKEDAQTFDNMMNAPNMQSIEAFLLLKGDGRIDQ
jgi:hypothetical protein